MPHGSASRSSSAWAKTPKPRRGCWPSWSRGAAGQLPNTDIDLRIWLDERGWIVRLACLRSDAEPIENELRRALMDRSLRLPPPEHMPQPIELRIRLMPGR